MVEWCHMAIDSKTIEKRGKNIQHIYEEFSWKLGDMHREHLGEMRVLLNALEKGKVAKVRGALLKSL